MEILGELNKYNIISFDIFDTLLLRTVAILEMYLKRYGNRQEI